MTGIPTTDTAASGIRLGTADASTRTQHCACSSTGVSDDDGRLDTCLLDSSPSTTTTPPATPSTSPPSTSPST